MDEKETAIQNNQETKQTTQSENKLTNQQNKQDSSQEKTLFQKIIANLVNFIYSPKTKWEKNILLLTVFGFILRFIAALNLNVLADDMVHVSQSAGILSAKILSTHSNPPLFYYLTDFSFKILGYTTLASRLWPLITGTLLIPLTFLVSSHIFKNKKIGFFSALFVTLSTFLIRNTFGEASLPVLFFSFLGIYLCLLYLDSRKLQYLIFSAIAFGLGTLTKYNTPFFLLALFVYSIIHLKLTNEKILTKQNFKHLLIFSAILFIFLIPIFTFNYLLYKDKGITDVYFSRVFQNEKSQQFYAGLAGQDTSFFQNLFNPENYSNIYLLYHTDLTILLFGLIGFIFLFFNKNLGNKKKIKVVSFIGVILIIPFFLQTAGSTLPKHFVFLPLFFSIPAGFFLNLLLSKFKSKNVKFLILILLIIIMIFNLGNNYSTPSNYLSPSATSQLKSFIDSNVQPDDLIILDNRIYTSRSFWLASPNNQLDMLRFAEFFNQNSQIPKDAKTPTQVYFIECAIDDCGWGSVKNQPGLNDSMENLFLQIGKNKPYETLFQNTYSGNEFVSKSEEQGYYYIYKETIPLNQNTVNDVNRFSSFYFVPYLYSDLSNYTFNYSFHSTFGRVIHKISYLIIWISIFLALISIFAVVYFLLKKK